MGSPDSRVASDSADTTSKNDSEDDDENGVHSPPSHPCPFSEGEKVLAFHSFLIYEAKADFYLLQTPVEQQRDDHNVLKTEYQLKEWRCYVHYLGWSKTWDEWVGLDRLLKFTEENVQKQLELNEKRGTDKKAARASQIKPKNVVKGRKRKNDASKNAVNVEKLVSIQIPLKLKKQLVDDSEFVTHLGKLVKLPRTPNVEDIMKKYLEYRLKKDGTKDESVGEIVKGLICYFDKALPAMLLYKSERQQYEELIVHDVSPSSIYGAEHLLRLFVRLPELLSQANIEEETLTELQQKLVDLLKFLRKNQNTFFLSSYHVPENMETSTNNADD
ncbi:protein MRG1-like isoform X3 [Cucurbita moschata]|uniref:Protein MRG1-like isoform X3 n=1 Tax=Cucurbita moschata TaxID=3662 RepID=A0A6J1F9F7_CUCMO|nr:protein MRG1-like isoform X3 [Cucurbita moschata]